MLGWPKSLLDCMGKPEQTFWPIQCIVPKTGKDLLLVLELSRRSMWLELCDTGDRWEMKGSQVSLVSCRGRHDVGKRSSLGISLCLTRGQRQCRLAVIQSPRRVACLAGTVLFSVAVQDGTCKAVGGKPLFCCQPRKASESALCFDHIVKYILFDRKLAELGINGSGLRHKLPSHIHQGLT